MKKPLSFWKKLKKLIEEEMPEGCSLAYDEGTCRLYMLKPNPVFDPGKIHTRSSLPGNMLEPMMPKAVDGGYQISSLVSEDLIEIELARLDY
ncbi:MAG: hypothetical protein NXI20_17930 [bacterium]|nr:hypothetical protein [bacterium]